MFMNESVQTSSSAAVIVGPMRPAFLILAPACVLLGVASARWTGSDLGLVPLILVFLGGLAAHIAVNALNEYDDFKSGLDLVTEPTPFSGGTKTLPNNPTKAHTALITGLVSLTVTVVIGIYFLTQRGLGLLPLGLLGCVIVVLYTRFMTRSPFWCLVAPGLGFGLLMVMGADFALSGSYTWTAFVASLVPFFLVSDLLLLNQFPDVEADRSVGRYHLLIALGRRAGLRMYGLFLLLAYLAIVAGWLFGVLPTACLLGLLTLPLAVSAYRGAVRNAENIGGLVPYLGKNVVVNIATPVLLAVGFFVSS
jgi:1,4-dihydroxy-2-naphthoate octaprenyltransferase